jgi:hypothetical protein
MGDFKEGTIGQRSLGFYLYRSAFPAQRGQLVCEARRAGAPPELVRGLSRLSAPTDFADLSALAAALDGGDPNRREMTTGPR